MYHKSSSVRSINSRATYDVNQVNWLTLHRFQLLRYVYRIASFTSPRTLATQVSCERLQHLAWDDSSVVVMPWSMPYHQAGFQCHMM